MRYKQKFLHKNFGDPDGEWKKLLSVCKSKYLSIESVSFINSNLDELLKFIGKHCYMTNQIVIATCPINNDARTQLSNAYKVIRHQIRAYSLKISSRELSSLRKSYIPLSRIFVRENVVKIPYKILMIFYAIYDIIMAIEKNSLLTHPKDKHQQTTYREALCKMQYERYCLLYELKHNEWQNSDAPAYKLDLTLYTHFNKKPLIGYY